LLLLLLLSHQGVPCLHLLLQQSLQVLLLLLLPAAAWGLR